MKYIKSCLKLFYKEQGIPYIKTNINFNNKINIKDYIKKNYIIFFLNKI